MGRRIFLKNRNLSGFFFYCFSIFASIWYGLYYVFFLFKDGEYLLSISRWAFASWILSIYSLLFFLKYFNHPKEKILWKKLFLIFVGYGMIVYLYLCTSWMIQWLEYNSIKHVYREVYGKCYLFTILLYLIFLISFIFYATKQIFIQRWLNRIRIKTIVLSTYIFLFALILLQGILPYYGIWIFEREIIFLFLFYIIFSYYTFHRYYFTSLGYGIGQSVVVVLTFIFSITLVVTGEYFLEIYTADSQYWQWSDQKKIWSVYSLVYFSSMDYIRYCIHFFSEIANLRNSKKRSRESQDTVQLPMISIRLPNISKRSLKPFSKQRGSLYIWIIKMAN